MQDRGMDKRTIAGMVSFLGLTGLLAFAVLFTTDDAQANAPLQAAILSMID